MCTAEATSAALAGEARSEPVRRDGVHPVRDPMLPHRYRVSRIRQETSDTFTLELRAEDGGIAKTFRPGQFNMLYLFGIGEVPISICGDPCREGPLLHTTREVGLVTRAMRKLHPGETIGVRGPYGTAWPVEEASGNDVVLVAGGIGLAPLRSALYYLLAHRDHYGKIVLLYGTRSPDDILYRAELEKWRSQLDLDVHVTVDRATGQWRGNVGVVTTLISRAPFDPQHTTAMICGPEVMMRFAVMQLAERGVRSEQTSVSMERNMQCGVGLCGHCQCGPKLVCKDGPVFRLSEIEPFFGKREV